MNDFDIEPYQEQVDNKLCKFCEEETKYDFCSRACAMAYWID
jgi:hypothetical protein|tara:strand:+ start:614 stop:739 length:126 start_codon:yes stop_codon:yes gene_type:complete